MNKTLNMRNKYPASPYRKASIRHFSYQLAIKKL